MSASISYIHRCLTYLCFRFCFVHFANEQDAKEAFAKSANLTIRGSLVDVNYARMKRSELALIVAI